MRINQQNVLNTYNDHIAYIERTVTAIAERVRNAPEDWDWKAGCDEVAGLENNLNVWELNLLHKKLRESIIPDHLRVDLYRDLMYLNRLNAIHNNSISQDIINKIFIPIFKEGKNPVEQEIYYHIKEKVMKGIKASIFDKNLGSMQDALLSLVNKSTTACINAFPWVCCAIGLAITYANLPSYLITHLSVMAITSLGISSATASLLTPLTLYGTVGALILKGTNYYLTPLSVDFLNDVEEQISYSPRLYSMASSLAMTAGKVEEKIVERFL